MLGIDPSDMIKDVAKFVGGKAFDASKEWVDYVWKYEEYLQKAQFLYHELEKSKEDIEQQVAFGRRKNEEIFIGVDEWLTGVKELMVSEDWKELLWDEIARKNSEWCCYGYCWNLKYRHDLSKKAVETSIAVTTKIEFMEKRGQTPLTVYKKLKFGESIGTYYCRGLPSRDDQLRKILKCLKDDKVNRIGIHGMGGAGKTTIAVELARLVYTENLFDEIIMVQISQFPDVTRMQQQIADCIDLSLDRHPSPEARARDLSIRLKNILKGNKSKHDEPRELVNDEIVQGQEEVQTEDIDEDGPGNNVTQIEKEKKPHDADEDSRKKEETKDIKEGGRGKSKKPASADKKDDQGKAKKSSDDETHGHEEEKTSKLLIILDNMWKKLDLQSVGIPYELENDLRCKIIITSRSEHICKTMGSEDSTFKVGDLTLIEAEHLFRQRVGKVPDGDDYKVILDKLLKKCSRLPLSINVLADTLKNQSLLHWERVLRKLEKPIHGETIGLLNDTYLIIEMSYNYIDSKEKRMFFLLCCLFPPGSGVPIYDVLKYGIGMGLFEYSNSLVEAMEQAYEWADELKSLSLFSDVNMENGEINLHDDVREAGKSIAAKGEGVVHVGTIPRWMKKDSYGKFTAISIDPENNNNDNSHVYLCGKSLPKLQLFRCLGARWGNIDDEYFSEMPNLKVLDLSKSDIKKFPSSIEMLENLETFLLEYCSLDNISYICKLKKLQVLSFRNSDISRFPEQIGFLEELKVLDLSGCDKLIEIPVNALNKLTQLEGLYMKNSFSRWEIEGSRASLTELSSMHLQVLEVQVKNIKQLPDEDFPFLNLSRYTIQFGASIPPRGITSSRDLQIKGLHAQSIVKKGWKHLVNQAETIYLENIQDLRNIAPHLGQYGLREIKRIDISHCIEMECLISGNEIDPQRIAFPKLETLCLTSLPHLKTICCRKYPPDLFSYLQVLILSDLDGLRHHGLSMQHASKLRVVEVKNCENLKYVFSSPTSKQKDVYRPEFQLRWLQKLYLADLPELRGLCGKANDEYGARQQLFPNKVKFSSLDELKVKHLGEIRELWDFATGNEFSMFFPKLQSISLEGIPKLKHVWSDELNRGSFSFANIKMLEVIQCDSLITICPPAVASALQGLEHLCIKYCDKVKQFISTERESEEEGVIPNKEMKFPKLFIVDLLSLPNLIFFYRGRLKISFPALESLRLINLSRLRTFSQPELSKSKASQERMITEDTGLLFRREVRFLFLEKLHLKRLPKIERLWDSAQDYVMMFPKLQSLSLDCMQGLEHVWMKELPKGTHCFIKLKKMTIESCVHLKSIYQPSAVRGTIISFDQLQTLRLDSLRSFNYFLKGKVELKFPALKDLKLTNLEKMLTFAALENSRGGYQDRDDQLVPLFCNMVSFPVLEVLQLQGLQKVQKIWSVTISIDFTSRLPNLQSVNIVDLPQIKHIWSNVLTEQSIYFGNLVNITIRTCEHLEYLFSSRGGSPQRDQSLKMMIWIPKLKRLELVGLNNLRSLVQESLNLRFQALKVMIIKELPAIEILIRRSRIAEEISSELESEEDDSTNEDDDSVEEASTEEEDDDDDQDTELTAGKDEWRKLDTVLFSGNVEFPSLEQLTIKRMPRLEYIYEINGARATAGGFLFPKLKKVHLTRGKLKELPERLRMYM